MLKVYFLILNTSHSKIHTHGSWSARTVHSRTIGVRFYSALTLSGHGPGPCSLPALPDLFTPLCGYLWLETTLLSLSIIFCGAETPRSGTQAKPQGFRAMASREALDPRRRSQWRTLFLLLGPSASLAYLNLYDWSRNWRRLWQPLELLVEISQDPLSIYQQYL
jgi:hypothetical protein